MFKHFLLDRDFLSNEAAPVPGQELEANEDGIGLMLEQAKAVDGGAVDGGEVGIIGFVAGIGGLSILFRGEGVNDADLEARRGESALNRSVIAARAARRDDDVL